MNFTGILAALCMLFACRLQCFNLVFRGTVASSIGACKQGSFAKPVPACQSATDMRT